ncbi:fibronectin type III domain-containing protein, partial [bacterium]|nr:fibronectin type III domain-containing protein [bacterium]
YNTSPDRFFNIDTIAPDMPVVTAEKKPEGEIEFSWPSLNDDSLRYYDVHITYSAEPITGSIGNVTSYSRSFSDEESVTFKVRAIDWATNEGAYSAEVVVTADASSPAPPSGFTAVVDNNAVLTSWVAVANDCAGYNIYKKTAEFALPDNAAKVNDVLITATSYQDSTLNLDAEYFYAVTAVDEVGNESEVSDRVSIQWDIYPPTAQISIIPGSPVKAGDLDVELQASEPLDTSQAYSLSIKTAGMTAAQDLPLTPSNLANTSFVASYTVDSTSGDGEAVFEFSGSDLSGKAGDQITSGKTFIIDTTPPGIPQYLYAQPLGNGEIKITWSPPQGEIPFEYFLYRSDAPDQAGQKFDVSIVNCEYIDVPDVDAIYYYSVTAVDEAGNESDIAGPAEVGCDSISPTARIVLSQESPLMIGKLLISLELSEIVKNEPILQMVTYNGDYFMINLQGSEKSWSGSIYLNETTPDGPGNFDFYAVDFSDNIGMTITEGADFIIETSPPTSFIEGFPLTVGDNLHYGFTLTSNESLSEVPEICVQYYDKEKQEIVLQNANDELTVFSGSVQIPSGASSGPAEFQFEGNDKYGNTGTVITSGKEFSVDSYPPSSPVIILAKAFPNRMVQLRWLCADTDIAEFEILMEGEEFSEIFSMNNKEIYLHTPDDGNYSFSVRAIDYVGNTGEYSNPVTLTTDGTPPYFTITCQPSPIVSPGDYTFTVFSSENLQSMPEIKWKPEYSDRVIVSGIFQVSDNEYSFVLSITGNEYDGLSHFEARGYDLVGNIGTEILSGKNHLVEISKPVCWIITNPSSPFGLGSIDINLKTNENIQGAPTLTAHFSDNVIQDVILTGSGNLWTGVLDTSSVAEGAGYFSFAATDFADKTSDNTSILSGRDFEVDLTDPVAPPLDADHIQGGKIRLYWTEPAGEDLVYELKRGVTDQLSSAVEIAVGIQGEEYFDYVSAAGDYYYWLNAVDDAGNESDYSGNWTDVNIGVFPPIINYPTTYSVNEDPFIVNGSTQTIKGTADPGAVIELFKGDTSVVADIVVDANGGWEYASLALLIDIDFVITAISTLGGVPSEKSLPITLTRDDIPGVPSGLAVIGHDTKISIRWDGNPNETDIAGYNIYRDNDPRPVNRSLIAHSGGGEHYYFDIGLTNGRTYSYRITAVDDNGNESPYSNEVSAQPIASSIWGVE